MRWKPGQGNRTICKMWWVLQQSGACVSFKSFSWGDMATFWHDRNWLPVSKESKSTEPMSHVGPPHSHWPHANGSHFSVPSATPLALAFKWAPFPSLSINRKFMKTPPKISFSFITLRFHCSCMANIRPQSGKAAPQACSVSELVKLQNRVCPLCVHVFESCFMTHCQELRYWASLTPAFSSCLCTSLSHN